MSRDFRKIRNSHEADEADAPGQPAAIVEFFEWASESVVSGVLRLHGVPDASDAAEDEWLSGDEGSGEEGFMPASYLAPRAAT